MPLPCAVGGAGVRRWHEQTFGNASGRSDRVPEHLPAGVKGFDRDRRGAVLLGVNNDVPGPAQNGTGPFAVLSRNRET